MALLYAAEPRNYAGDVDWPYRQENNFYYLTGIAQEGGALVLIPGASVREILFLPPSNPAQETWTGHILTPDEGAADLRASRRSGTRGSLKPFLATLLPQAATHARRKTARRPMRRGGARPALPRSAADSRGRGRRFRDVIELAG